MSETLHLKAAIDALCKGAGLEPNDVALILLDGNTGYAQFTVYTRPRRFDPETDTAEHVIITLPFDYKD